MNLSSPFIRRPVMTWLVMLAIILSGLWSAFKLPVNDLPSIEYPHIKVTTFYSGASPEKILNLITQPLENELASVKGLEEISSESSDGLSSISLSFKLEKNMDGAVQEVQSAINRAIGFLPTGLTTPPTYSLDNASQEAIMYLSLSSEEANVAEMRTLADDYIIPRLSRIESVSQVGAFGSPASIWITLNPQVLASHHISFQDVIGSIHQYTHEAPLGNIQTGSHRLSIELLGRATQAKELLNLPIGASGLKLKDIAEVSEKQLNDQKFHLVNQQERMEVVFLQVKKISEGNTVAISKQVQQLIEEIKRELPPYVSFNAWFDKAIWIKGSLFDVEMTLLIAFILVVFVIYLSLGRFSQSWITCLALPLSLIGTLTIIHFLGFSLDLLSLLAITLSVGFVVDDAIVVLENIVRHQEMGMSPRQASFEGSKQISFTILSMTLSIVAVFIPLLFMPGMNGRLFHEFSVTLSVAILMSGFISLTLTPMLCSRFLSHHEAPSKVQEKSHAIHERFLKIYGRTLKRSLKWPKLTVLLAILSIAATGYLFTKLPINLIPPEDRGFLFAFCKLPAGMAQEQINQKQTSLENILQKQSYLDNFISMNFNDNLFFVVHLKERSHRGELGTVCQHVQKLFDDVPGIQTFVSPYRLINLGIDFNQGGQYQMVVRSQHFEEIEAKTQEITDALRTEGSFPFVQNSLSQDKPILAVTLDEERLYQLGISKKQIQDLFNQAYGGVEAGSLQRGTIQQKIFLELETSYQDSLSAPSKLYLMNQKNQLIPLKSLATWKQALGSGSLMRKDKLPSATINFSLKEDLAPSEGIEKARLLAQNLLPSNVSLSMEGSAKLIASTSHDTLLLLVAAALVMYLVLGMLYESFIHPLTILSSIPFAGLGGVLTLFIFNEPLSIFSAVGFLLLIGIVKKNGIMMIDYAIEAQKQGLSPYQAVQEACLVRLRPILMTTFAAVMGAFPIAIGLGDSAEMLRGLGLVIVGGLLFSQVLTLYVTPSIYLLFEKWSFRFKVDSNEASAE